MVYDSNAAGFKKLNLPQAKGKGMLSFFRRPIGRVAVMLMEAKFVFAANRLVGFPCGTFSYDLTRDIYADFPVGPANAFDPLRP